MQWAVTGVVLVVAVTASTSTARETLFGPFFVGADVPPGDDEASAATADGTEYLAGEVSMRGDATTSAMLTPGREAATTADPSRGE